jgi:pyruvate dehydrogenase (quinone)
MLGINGLITIAAHWRRWRDPRLVVMVLNNSDLNMVTWEQRATAGDPKYEPSQTLPPFPYAEYARQLGLRGLRVDDPMQVGPAWDEALTADAPMVLEMVTDPNVPPVPPVPPHVTGQQMRAYLMALLKGDAEARQVMRASAKEWWADVSASLRGKRG